MLVAQKTFPFQLRFHLVSSQLTAPLLRWLLTPREGIPVVTIP